MKLKVIFKPRDEGGFTVQVPSLPGCISEGETLEEAPENIREASGLYLDEEPQIIKQANLTNDEFLKLL